MNKALTTALTAGILATSIQAQEAKMIDWTSKTDVLSEYVYYGALYQNTPVLQQYVTASHTFKDSEVTTSAIGFFNRDLKAGEWNETDFTFSLSKGLGSKATLTLGYNLYASPTQWFPTTHELTGNLSFNLPGNPALLMVGDVDQVKGMYIQPSLSHSVNLNKIGKAEIGLAGNVALGYNHNYYRTGSGISHVEAQVSMPIKIGDRVTFSPSIKQVEPLSRDFRRHTILGGTIEFKF